MLLCDGLVSFEYCTYARHVCGNNDNVMTNVENVGRVAKSVAGQTKWLNKLRTSHVITSEERKIEIHVIFFHVQRVAFDSAWGMYE